MAQTAALRGLVVDSASHRPLPQALVVLYGTPYQQQTDTAGRFQFDSLPPGQYEVGVLRIGFLGKIRRIVRIEPGRTCDILLSLWHPVTRADTCRVAADLARTTRLEEEEDTRDSLATFSRRLRLPPLERLPSGEVEVRFWEEIWEDQYRHLLRVHRQADAVSGELVRWWHADGHASQAALAARYRQRHRDSGICAEIWQDAGYDFCRIPLRRKDLRPFLDTLASYGAQLAGRPPLPPPDSTDCRFRIVLEGARVALEIADAQGFRWYSFWSSTGGWLDGALVAGLRGALQRIQHRYWIDQQ